MFFGPQASQSPVGSNSSRPMVRQGSEYNNGQNSYLENFPLNMVRSNSNSKIISPSFGVISPTMQQSAWSPTDQDNREWSMFSDGANAQLQLNGAVRQDAFMRNIEGLNDFKPMQHQQLSNLQHMNNVQHNNTSQNPIGNNRNTIYTDSIPIQRSNSLGAEHGRMPMKPYQPGPPAVRSNSGNSVHKLTLDNVVKRQTANRTHGSPRSGNNTPSSPNHHAHDHYLLKLSQNNPQGSKTFRLRKSYLENCKQYQIVPSMELMRSFKTCIKAQQSLKRLSICHALLEDQHVSALIDTLISSGGHDVDEILLNHNAITDVGATELSERLLKRHDSSIVSLELFGNKIGDHSCIAIANTLSSDSGGQLKRLKLGDNCIGSQGAEVLARGLLQNHTLTQLHLGGNNIGAHGLECIAKSLCHNTTLTSLGLRDNHVGGEGMRHLSAALMQPTCALSDVQLKGNFIGPEGAAHLAEALRVNKSLKVLELQSNDIGHLGARLLCDALCSNESVHAVNFNDNELGDEGADAVANLLQHNRSITTLGLASNRIRKRGAASLSDSLGLNHLSQITGLDLGGNEIGNNGAVALSKALVHNNTMTSLDLRSCEIHLKGCMSLAEVSQYNTTLRHLDLGANHCKNQGAIAWADVLKNNSSLTRLCLTDNQVSHEGGLALATAMQTNFSLRNFSYGGQGPRSNKIESSIRKVIDSIVSENKRHWENLQGGPSEEDKPLHGQEVEDEDQQSVENQIKDDLLSLTQDNTVTLPYFSNNQYRTIDVYKMCDLGHGQSQQSQQSPPRSVDDIKLNQSSPSMNQTIPSWFSASSNISRQPIDAAQLDQRLEYLFKNNLLKAQNPKFTGCYFIGNVINTLKKVFGEYSRLDEYQLVQFTFHNPKYYVHLSREMVKTQIKYIGDSLQHQQQPMQQSMQHQQQQQAIQYQQQPGMIRSRSMPQQRTSPFGISPQSITGGSPNYLPQSHGLIGEMGQHDSFMSGSIVSSWGAYNHSTSPSWAEHHSYNTSNAYKQNDQQDHYSHF